MNPDPVHHSPNEFAQRVRGVGVGVLATLTGRAFDVLVTYFFYAVIARSLTVGDFGRLALGFVVLQAAALICRFGLDQALLATLTRGPANRFGIQIVLALSVAVSTLAVPGCLIAGHPSRAFAFSLAAALPCVAVGQFIVGALRAAGAVPTAALAETVVQPSIAAAGALIVSIYSPSVASFALVFAVSWAIVLPFVLRVDWHGERLNRQAKLALVRTGRSLLGAMAFHQTSVSADLFLLGWVVAAAEVGRYAAAHKIAAAFLILHGAIATAVTPFMREVKDERPLLARYYQTVARWMLTLSLPLIVFTVGSPRFMLSIFGSDYASASTLPVILLSLGGVVTMFVGPAGSTLLCTGHARELMRVTAVGAASLIVAVAALSRFGPTGAAAGVLLGRLIGRGLMLLAMRRYVRIDFADAPLLLIAAAAFVGVAANYVATPLIGVLPAAALGCTIAIALACVVLTSSGDVAVLRTEFRRA